ncbi:YihY/virulence factor BrkB family protein [Aetokthonos hydrillicola Thurmond2011]|jgi:membrane protein|uniref:YihY/virulence factor BrkB family protein n=1 Tax=Aetokthonos hydrillicola Thurmond2011 TaxID=2712845 RepID=A0AAP5IB17_9CYAN|nr:YihY/virulence factor BrkB family protein [Aetokthonos hydrillicola]MBO3460707.1 YihY/virulence factor BrkB family protein [Aetokthonos hydrillicola CCALA 1050]MBW4587704.1 YihY/virulence factor BrkB family protein [Aetokthonos hydrillicola CCALA 1050]MDR9897914.1 YihY/virulence factor BrkB family protein [Aetokthonos hydrillicola Thurmond2011]
MKPKAILGLFQETFSEWSKDNASRLAAALAYYTIFSLAPLLIIVIAIAGSVFGEDAARGAIENELRGLVGSAAAEVIQTAIQNASKPRQGTIASIISIVVLLFGATGVFAELQNALNTIWGVQPKPGRAVKNIIRQRSLSFAMVLGIGFLLLVSLIISAILVALVAYFKNLVPGIDSLWYGVNFLLGFIVTTLLFALIFKVLPDAKITWSDVLVGAALTALLFSVGRFLLGEYLGNSSFGSTYGAAGSIVVILVWVYYSSQILFFGAEFTQVYAKKYGSRITPDKNAIPLDTKNDFQQRVKLSRTSQTRTQKLSSNWINHLLRHFHVSKRLKRKKRRN